MRWGYLTIVCTGCATSPSVRMAPSCAPAPHPEHSRPSATWRSAPCAWPDAPTSPTPAATCTTTTTPSPHSESETVKPSQIGHLATTPGPWGAAGIGLQTAGVDEAGAIVADLGQDA